MRKEAGSLGGVEDLLADSYGVLGAQPLLFPEEEPWIPEEMRHRPASAFQLLGILGGGG